MIIADSNVLLDVLGDEPRWFDWSTDALDVASRSGPLAINALIYSEIAPRFESVTTLDAFVRDSGLHVETLTHEMLFRAGHAHRQYRRAGGERRRVLPDFIIGAHAAVREHALLTRDPKAYRTYFPTVRLITP